MAIIIIVIAEKTSVLLHSPGFGRHSRHQLTQRCHIWSELLKNVCLEVCLAQTLHPDLFIWTRSVSLHLNYHTRSGGKGPSGPDERWIGLCQMDFHRESGFFFTPWAFLGYDGLIHINLDVEGSALAHTDLLPFHQWTITYSIFFFFSWAVPPWKALTN